MNFLSYKTYDGGSRTSVSRFLNLSLLPSVEWVLSSPPFITFLYYSGMLSIRDPLNPLIIKKKRK